ncbi:hypothetical protein B0T20DRAFT_398758, partial [Sordaria brevicollis]
MGRTTLLCRRTQLPLIIAFMFTVFLSLVHAHIQSNNFSSRRPSLVELLHVLRQAQYCSGSFTVDVTLHPPPLHWPSGPLLASLTLSCPWVA